MFFVGIFWRRANANGAFATLAVMVPFGLAGFVLIEVLELTDLHFTYAAFAPFLVSCLLLAAVSLATGAPPEEKLGEYTWRAGTGPKRRRS